MAQGIPQESLSSDNHHSPQPCARGAQRTLTSRSRLASSWRTAPFGLSNLRQVRPALFLAPPDGVRRDYGAATGVPICRKSVVRLCCAWSDASTVCGSCQRSDLPSSRVRANQICYDAIVNPFLRRSQAEREPQAVHVLHRSPIARRGLDPEGRTSPHSLDASKYWRTPCPAGTCG